MRGLEGIPCVSARTDPSLVPVPGGAVSRPFQAALRGRTWLLAFLLPGICLVSSRKPRDPDWEECGALHGIVAFAAPVGFYLEPF